VYLGSKTHTRRSGDPDDVGGEVCVFEKVQGCGNPSPELRRAAARSSRGRFRRPGAQTETKRCQLDARGHGKGEGAEEVDRGRRCLPEPAASSSDLRRRGGSGTA
jgi:hypothetical protein